MANVRNSNTFFIDTAAADTNAATAGNLATQNIKVLYIILTATAASAVFTLKDISTGVTKFSLNIATAGTTTFLDFSRKPAVFPNGISPSAVTNCNATLILEESRA